MTTEEPKLRYEIFNRWIWDLNPSLHPPQSIPPGQPRVIKVNEDQTYLGHGKPLSLNDEPKSQEMKYTLSTFWPLNNAPKYPLVSEIVWYLPAKNGVIQIKNFYEKDVFIGTSRKKMSIEKLTKEYKDTYARLMVEYSQKPPSYVIFKKLNPKKKFKSLKGLRVLYVEDDGSMCELMQEAIPMIDWTIANTGLEGLHLALTKKFDCILTGIYNPGIIGTDMIKMLRNHKKSLKDTPMIVLSAAFPGMAVQVAAVGANAGVAKPIDLGEFIDFLKKLLLKKKHENTRAY